MLVLLDGVFQDGSHDGASDGTENTVVSFVACKSTRETACDSTAESSFALLGSTGSVLVIVARERKCQLMLPEVYDCEKRVVGQVTYPGCPYDPWPWCC